MPAKAAVATDRHIAGEIGPTVVCTLLPPAIMKQAYDRSVLSRISVAAVRPA